LRVEVPKYAIFTINLNDLSSLTINPISFVPPIALGGGSNITGYFRDAILDPYTRLSYWLVGSETQTVNTLCRVVRFNLVTQVFSAQDSYDFDKQCLTMFMNFDDTTTLYIASNDASESEVNFHAPIVKFQVLPTMETEEYIYAQNEVEPYLSSIVDSKTNIAYFGTSTRNASLVYFNVTDFSYIGRDTLSIPSVGFAQTENARALYLDNNGYLYVGLGLPLGVLKLQLKAYSAAVTIKPIWVIQSLLIIILSYVYRRVKN